VIVSLLWSKESYSAGNIRDLFFQIFVPFIFGYLATFYISNQAYRRNLVKHATFSSFILSTIAIINFVIHYDSNIDEMRSAATLQNPNALAILLVTSIPLVLYGIQGKILNKRLACFYLTCIVLGVFSTISRKGIITAGVSFGLYFLAMRYYKAFFLYVVIITALIIVAVNIRPVAERFEQEELNVQVQGKWYMTLAGWEMFVKNPVIGLGYKGYNNEFGQYFKDSGKTKYDAHNSFITSLANYGLIGSIPFIGIFLLPLTKSLKSLLRCPGRDISLDERAKNATGIAIVIPFMVSAWFAGDLMYLAAITSVLYVLIPMFCIPSKRLGFVTSPVSQKQ
jgi:O-antigen ligase